VKNYTQELAKRNEAVAVHEKALNETAAAFVASFDGDAAKYVQYRDLAISNACRNAAFRTPGTGKAYVKGAPVCLPEGKWDATIKERRR
jgi:hypothetical protein